LENQLRLIIWNSEPESRTTVAQIPLPIAAWVPKSDKGILEQGLANKHAAPL